MKTRIISGIVGIVIFVLVLALSSYFPVILVTAIALICAAAVYEMLKNTGLCKTKLPLIAAMVFGFISPFILTKYIPVTFEYFIIVFCLVNIIFTLAYHGETDVVNFVSTVFFPIAISYAFSSIITLSFIKNSHLFWFLQIFVFAWGADTFAYFTGVFCGKHKLCPEISPKKTVEGAIGGIAGSVLLTLVLCLVYSRCLKVDINIPMLLIAGAVFAVVGMIGDLIMSQIKRKCGIKDYGNIMPGHGGVLDRFDSVLLISPIFLMFIKLFSLA